MIFKTDCRHWRGDKPCLQNRLCEGCEAYLPLWEKILLIKLGASGDVLRTTPLVTGLRRRFPQAHLTWVTLPESAELLSGLPGLDRVLAYSLESALEIMARSFDWVICLDKEPHALALAALARTAKRSGWTLAANGTGTPAPASAEADYATALGVSDELKFKQNTKTYPQIIFEAAGLEYAGEPYLLALTDADRKRPRDFFRRHAVGPKAKVLGLFTGCGPAFARKRWTEAGFAALARRAARELKAKVLLLGGPAERAVNARIRRLAKVPLLDIGGEQTLREFAGFLERCRVVVTGDTLALHLSAALGRRVVALFGPTCAQEIELFGRGEKVVTPLACAPCYRRTCGEDPTCMDALSVDTVWQALRRQWREDA